MPILNWHKVHEGNFNYLYVDNNVAPSARDIKALQVILRELMDEFVARFGFGKSFIDICNKKAELIKLYAKRIQTGDRYYETFIDICENELRALEAKGERTDFFEYKAYIEQGLGRAIDETKTSVAQFYNYIKFLEKNHGRGSH